MNVTYSLREAAKVVGVSRHTLRRWLEESGWLVPHAAGGRGGTGGEGGWGMMVLVLVGVPWTLAALLGWAVVRGGSALRTPRA